MEVANRTKKSIINSIFSVASHLIIVLIKILQRKFMLTYLGVEILGINAVFTNMASLFSIAELGFGTAISYMMYKPLAEGNTEKVKTLFNFYKKIYYCIGFFTMMAFIIVAPFVHVFTKDLSIDNWTLAIYFLIFGAATAIPSFFSHTHAVVWADQKGYLDKVVVTAGTIVFTILQVVVLIVFKNFYAFLIVFVLSNLVPNVIMKCVVQRKYPYLRGKNAVPLEKEEKHTIKKKVTGLLAHKMSTIFANSVDTIILSAMISVVISGIYSNYLLLFTTISGILTQIIFGVYASIGNAWVASDEQNVRRSFYNLKFLMFMMTAISSIMLFCLSTPFVSLLFGAEYTLDFIVLLTMSINFYITNSRLVVVAYKENKGIFEQDIYRPICETIVKLTLSILFVKLFGVVGVLLGTLAGSVLVGLWIEPMVLFKYGFKDSLPKYLFNYVLQAALTVGVGALTYYICSFFGDGIGGFALKTIVAAVLPTTIFVLVVFRKSEMKYYWQLAKRILLKKKVAIVTNNSDVPLTENRSGFDIAKPELNSQKTIDKEDLNGRNDK